MMVVEGPVEGWVITAIFVGSAYGVCVRAVRTGIDWPHADAVGSAAVEGHGDDLTAALRACADHILRRPAR